MFMAMTLFISNASQMRFTVNSSVCAGTHITQFVFRSPCIRLMSINHKTYTVSDNINDHASSHCDTNGSGLSCQRTLLIPSAPVCMCVCVFTFTFTSRYISWQSR